MQSTIRIFNRIRQGSKSPDDLKQILDKAKQGQPTPSKLKIGALMDVTPGASEMCCSEFAPSTIATSAAEKGHGKDTVSVRSALKASYRGKGVSSDLKCEYNGESSMLSR